MPSASRDRSHPERFFGPGHREEVRDVPPSAGRGIEPQPHRLRHHVDQVGREVEGQQKAGLLQTFGPVMTTSADEELQSGAVALSPPPGEPAHRRAVRDPCVGQVPHSARHLVARRPPGRRPATSPLRPEIQPASARCHGHRNEQLLPPAPMRPEAPVRGSGPARGLYAGTRSVHITREPPGSSGRERFSGAGDNTIENSPEVTTIARIQ